jgi:hypothetical protein
LSGLHINNTPQDREQGGAPQHTRNSPTAERGVLETPPSSSRRNPGAASGGPAPGNYNLRATKHCLGSTRMTDNCRHPLLVPDTCARRLCLALATAWQFRFYSRWLSDNCVWHSPQVAAFNTTIPFASPALSFIIGFGEPGGFWVVVGLAPTLCEDKGTWPLEACPLVGVTKKCAL